MLAAAAVMTVSFSFSAFSAESGNTEGSGENQMYLSGRTLAAEWTVDENGNWKYYIPARMFENEWGYIYNPYADPDNGQAAFDWFHFGEDGIMDTGWFTDNDGYIYYLNPVSDGTKGHVLTGWQWIRGSDGEIHCYYFSESEDENPGESSSSSDTGPYGSLYVSAVTPDGYTVDETGAYVENGVRVTR